MILSSCLSQFLTSLFLKTSAREISQLPQATEGLLQVQDVLVPTLLF